MNCSRRILSVLAPLTHLLAVLLTTARITRLLVPVLLSRLTCIASLVAGLVLGLASPSLQRLPQPVPAPMSSVAVNASAICVVLWRRAIRRRIDRMRSRRPSSTAVRRARRWNAAGAASRPDL